MNKLGQLIGVTTTDEVVLLNQQTSPVPYKLQDLLILEDSAGNIYPVEVTKSMAFGDFERDTIKDIIEGESTLHVDGVEKDKPIYVAKARSLRDLMAPIPPNSIVRKPSFDEIEEHLIYAEEDRSFHLGVVKGTEGIHDELPDHLKNLSPMWDEGKNSVVPQEGVPFLYDFHSLREYPHIGLFGSSGSGKSFGIHSILEEFMMRRIPGIYLDPHNEGVFKKTMNGLPKEHQRDFSGHYDTFKVGKNLGIPFSQLTVDDLYYLIEFVGGVSDAQRAALDAIYEQGDTFSHLNSKMENLKVAFDYFDSPAWGRQEEEREFRNNNPEASALYDRVHSRVANVSVVEALTWRLVMLEKTNIFDERTGIDGVVSAIQSGRMAIIQGNIRKLQMVSSYLIRELYGKRRKYVDSKEFFGNDNTFFPPFIIAGDEFHNFAPNGYSNPTGRMIREIAKEARKYGVYLVVSTQRTTAIDEDVFAQLNTKFIYRLNTFTDIELTTKEANLTEEQTKQLPKLLRGQAFVSNPKIPRTMLIKFRTTFTEPTNIDDPFDELAKQFANTNNDVIDVLKVYLDSRPIRVTDIPQRVLPLLKDELDRSVTFDETIESLDQMVTLGSVEKEQSPFGVEYRNKK